MVEFVCGIPHLLKGEYTEGAGSGIDVYSLPVLSINSLAKKGGDGLEVIAPVEDSPIACDGAAFAKDQTALRDAFDKGLAELKESGEFAALIEPYGFSAAAAMKTSREKLCSTPE